MEGENTEFPSYINTLVNVFTNMFYLVWYLHYILTVIFILVEGKIIYHFQKYSVTDEKYEEEHHWLEFGGKIFCLSTLSLFSIIEFGRFFFTEKLNHDWTQLLLSFMMISFLIVSIWTTRFKKISLDTSISRFKNYEFNLFIFLFASGEMITLFQKIGESSYGEDTNLPDKSFWVLFLLRASFLTPLIVEPWAPSEEESVEKKDGAKDDKEPTKNVSFLSAITHFYPMRHYLLPSTRLTQVYFVLLLGFIGLDSLTDFLTSIYSLKILNSLQVESAKFNGTKIDPPVDGILSAQAGSMRLQFRWDYILTYFAIQFFQGNFIYMVKFYLKKEVEKESCSRLQMDIFAKLHDLSIRWHIENQATEVFSLMSSAPSILQNLLQSLSWLAPDLLRSFLTLGYLINSYSFKLSSIVIAAAIMSTIIDLFLMKRRDKALRAIIDAEREVRSVRGASFENFETVKYFTNEEYENSKYAKAYFEEEKQELNTNVTYFGFSIVRDIFQSSAEMIVILIVVKLIVEEKGLNTGDYMYFLSVFSRILSPVQQFISFYQELQNNAMSAEKVGAILNAVPEIADEPNAPPLEIDSFGGSIEFRNVGFSYVPERQILTDLNIVIPCGHTVALVGHSGCGKSTITKLLFRFYDPTAGEILVNGQNIRKVQCKSLRKSVGVVPQDVILFDESIRDNIKYGRVLTATDEDIEEAAKAACLHERIESFPEKYETEVGSRGLKLSGGEKQRVAIARSVLKNPPILILDEATSSLDTETEKQIQVSLEKLCENRTTLIIAHRLSTIVHANQIVVLKEGMVVETGTHTELLAKDGVYAGMWLLQFNSTSTIPREEKLEWSQKDNSRLRQRREMFSSRMRQTVWASTPRRALSLYAV